MPGQKPEASLLRLYSTAENFTLQYLQHKRRDVEPKGLKWAKDNGYKQVHVAMLAQCEQPPAAKLPAFRAALIALETAFYVLRILLATLEATLLRRGAI